MNSEMWFPRRADKEGGAELAQDEICKLEERRAELLRNDQQPNTKRVIKEIETEISEWRRIYMSLWHPDRSKPN